MAFALVNFYEESNSWEVIPVTDIVLEPRQKKMKSIEGIRTLVRWKKGNGSREIPALIEKVSDDKEYLYKVLRGEEDTTPSKQGKGLRKRTLNRKYFLNDDDENIDPEPEKAKPKRIKITGKNKETEKRFTDLANVIKEKYKKDNHKSDSECEDDIPTGPIPRNEALIRENNLLKQENARLKAELKNVSDMKLCISKLKKYLFKLEVVSEPRAAKERSELLYSMETESLVIAEPKKLPMPSSPDNVMVAQKIPEPPQKVQVTSNGSPSGDMIASTEPPQKVQVANCNSGSLSSDMICLGPRLQLKKNVFHGLKAKKIGSYVANLMGATLSREHMATHTLKGQKAKTGAVKPKLDDEYVSSLMAHALSVRYSGMDQNPTEYDVKKAIKFKLNNEEAAWKRQNTSDE